MKNSIIILLSCITFFISSCEEKDIAKFNGENSIYFEKFYCNELSPGQGVADSTIATYFMYPDGTKDISAKLVVNLSGKLLIKDTEFQLKVVDEETTATQEEYTIKDRYTFHADKIKEEAKTVTDTIEIQFHKSDRLEGMDEGVRLVVELVPNDNLELGQHERRKAVLILTTSIMKPEWWDYEVTSKLLGNYSPKKLKLFINNVDTKSEMSIELIKERPDRAIELAIQFRNWLNSQETPIKEEDGTIMTVNV